MHGADYRCIDRDLAPDRVQAMRECLLSDVFITGANALSLEGEMAREGQCMPAATMFFPPSEHQVGCCFMFTFQISHKLLLQPTLTRNQTEKGTWEV